MRPFIQELKLALQVVLFNEKAMHEVAANQDKTKFAYLILAIGPVLGAIGQVVYTGFYRPSFLSSLFMIVMEIITMIVTIYIVSYIATSIFKGTAKHDAFFRVAAYGTLVGWASLIPFLGVIAGLWMLVLAAFILKNIHKLTTGGAILTLIIGWIILMVLSMIFSPFINRVSFGIGPGWDFRYRLWMMGY